VEFIKARLIIEQNKVKIKIDRKLLFVINIFFKKITANESKRLAISGSKE
jgi:hypothetical protein